ncbi:MAG: BatD family protein [Prevotellaceae bacterium]|jgi:heme exporter protein D|nr:BatD family protein [Prevotellaceae bacterium]
MMKRFFIFLIILLDAGMMQAQTVEFTASAPRIVTVGEAFRITFTLNNEFENFTAPDFGGFSVLAGPSRSTSTSVQIINGKTSYNRSVSMVYILQANQEGTINIGAAEALVEGKAYQTKTLSIQVVAGGNTSQNGNTQTTTTQEQAPESHQNINADETDVFTRIHLSKSTAVQGEYMIATIKLYTRQMNIAGFEDVKFPTFNGFWSQELETPQQLQFQRENVNGKLYNTALLRRYILFPQQTGTLKIDPFEVNCVLQVYAKNSQPRSFFDSFFDSPQNIRKHIQSPPTTIKVEPLPSGAPASFKGAVGNNFRMDAAFNRDSVTANDALSLIVKITGEGNIKLVEKPKVNFPPHFETYDVKTSDNTKTSSSGISGTKQFEYPVIPRNEGSFDIPPVEFTYFDITKKQYVTLRSKNLHLGVAKDPNASTATSIAGVNRQSIKALGSDILYIKTKPLRLHEKGFVFFGTWSYYLMFVLLFTLFIIIYYSFKNHIKKLQDVTRTRHRKANRIAQQRLKTAGQYLKSGDRNNFYEEVSRALWGFLTDKSALMLADLSRETAREVMQRKHAKEEDIEAYLHLLDECEYARYAPNAGRSEMEKVYHDATNIISKFEQTF